MQSDVATDAQDAGAGTTTMPTLRRLKNITISLTLECNQGCAHCWVSAGTAGSAELDNEEIEDVLQQARDLGAIHVKFTGGEPLLRSNFIGLVRTANDLGYRISIETNGTTLKEALLSQFLPYLDRIHFYVSLDGSTPEIHDEFRMRRGAFRSTIKNLRALRRAGGYFSIHTVATRANLAQIPQIYSLARELGASQMKLILSVHDLGRGRQVQDSTLNSTEIFDLLERMPSQRLWDYEWAPERTRDTVLMTTLPPAFQPDGLGDTCGWSQSFLAILANGDVAICHGAYDLDEAKAGNVRATPLAQIWLSGRLFTETGSWQGSDLQGICGNCVVADRCRGLCRATAISTYGDLKAPYPMCQRMYEAGMFPRSMQRDPGMDSTYRASVRMGGRKHLPLVVLGEEGGTQT